MQSDAKIIIQHTFYTAMRFSFLFSFFKLRLSTLEWDRAGSQEQYRLPTVAHVSFAKHIHPQAKSKEHSVGTWRLACICMCVCSHLQVSSTARNGNTKQQPTAKSVNESRRSQFACRESLTRAIVPEKSDFNGYSMGVHQYLQIRNPQIWLYAVPHAPSPSLPAPFYDAYVYVDYIPPK